MFKSKNWSSKYLKALLNTYCICFRETTCCLKSLIYALTIAKWLRGTHLQKKHSWAILETTIWVVHFWICQLLERGLISMNSFRKRFSMTKKKDSPTSLLWLKLTSKIIVQTMLSNFSRKESQSRESINKNKRTISWTCLTLYSKSVTKIAPPSTLKLSSKNTWIYWQSESYRKLKWRPFIICSKLLRDATAKK